MVIIYLTLKMLSHYTAQVLLVLNDCYFWETAFTFSNHIQFYKSNTNLVKL